MFNLNVMGVDGPSEVTSVSNKEVTDVNQKPIKLENQSLDESNDKGENGDGEPNKTDFIPGEGFSTLKSKYEARKKGPDGKEIDEKNDDLYQKNKAMRELLYASSEYITEALNLGMPEGKERFTPIEKDNIKLVMIDEIQSDLSIGKNLEAIILSVFTAVREGSLAGDVEVKSQQSIGKTIKKLNNISKDLSKVFDNLGLEGKMKIINTKIKKIIEAKDSESKKSFDKLGSVLETLNGKKDGRSEEQIFKDIKQSTDLFGDKMGSATEAGEYAREAFNNLPQGGREMIRGILTSLVAIFPFLKNIFEMFLGKDILNESADKGINCVNNLKEYVSSENFPLKDNKLKDEKELKKLDKLKADELKPFFSYLGDNVEYGKEDFWKELLSGNSKDKKIQEAHGLLKDKGEKILDKNEGIDELVEKLNGLKDKKLKLAREKPLEDRTEEEKDIVETEELKNEIKNIPSIPTNIDYKGKKISLAIEKNNLVVNGKTFNISIKVFGSEQFQTIEFIEGKNGGFVLNGKEDKPIPLDKAVNLIKDLLTNEHHVFEGSFNGFSYTGEITKVS